MIKKNVQFTNYDDKVVTETFYFHMSQVELLRWEAELEHVGGVSGYFKETMESGNGGKIMGFMEDLIGRSYGEKSENGNKHLKSPEILANFKDSAAYDTFFMSLVTNSDAAAELLNGIIPKELAENVDKMTKLDRIKANVDARKPPPAVPQDIEEEPQPEPSPEDISDPRAGGNVFKPEVRVLTRAEVRDMDHAELSSGLAEGRYIIGNEK